MAVESVGYVEFARTATRGHVAESDIHRTPLPDADSGQGGIAHIGGELILAYAACSRALYFRKQIGDRVGAVLLRLRFTGIGRGKHRHVHDNVVGRDDLAALELVG